MVYEFPVKAIKKEHKSIKNPSKHTYKYNIDLGQECNQCQTSKGGDTPTVTPLFRPVSHPVPPCFDLSPF